MSRSARIAVLLGATALAGFVLQPVAAYADPGIVIGGNRPKAQGGHDGFGDTRGQNGQQGPNVAPQPSVSSTNQTTSGVPALLGAARGGDGGDGGTALSCEILPPSCEIEGGQGGDGGKGGVVDVSNTAVLDATGAPGFAVDASGGWGGKGGWGASLGFSDGGDGGKGGDGGNARGVAGVTSVITTHDGDGIHVVADGGRGGDGGNGGSIVVGQGGYGGQGGAGGTAYGENTGTTGPDGNVTGGRIETFGDFSKGLLVRAAGGTGGDGHAGGGLIHGGGGNGGDPTIGGDATGVNGGTIVTHGNWAHGMSVQSIGGGGGDGGGSFGAWGGGGAGADGNDALSATGTNSGNITTNGVGAIGMLVEAIGGGGGDGGGAIGFVAVGGDGDGGGEGGAATANIGGTIRTGADGSGDGAIGVLVQSVGGGGGNGGFGVAVSNTVAVSVGGSGGTGGGGHTVTVRQEGSGAVVSTSGASATGIMAQSIGGGGGNGGWTVAAGVASIAVGGKGGAGGAGGDVDYRLANATVTTNGPDSIGILAQSVGGGGGNGGFAISAGAVASVGIGGAGNSGGAAKSVTMTTGGSVTTNQERSTGIVAQSIGGGGGNGGFAGAGSFGAAVGVGGSGDKGGEAGTVKLETAEGGTQTVVTNGDDSAGVIAQSIGGGGGNGGFAGTVSVAANVGVGGSGAGGGGGKQVDVTYNGSVTTKGERSIGIIAQSVGGGGGNGGGTIGVNPIGLASVGIGGSGAGGGDGGIVNFTSTTGLTVNTEKDYSAGVIAQSIGGGGGNGGFAFNLALGAAVGIGGKGGTASSGDVVTVDISGGSIHTKGFWSTGLIAQSIGGGGGNGGGVISISATANVSIGGKGGKGGEGKAVNVTNGAAIRTEGGLSHGILAQSVGGGGGSGGYAFGVGGPTFSLGGQGASAGGSKKVTVKNSGRIETGGDLSNGIFAQSVGGSGGDGGLAVAGGAFAAVSVGGKGGGGGSGGEVEVTNTATIITHGALSHGILAQSIGGGGGNGGSAGALAAGVFGAAAVAIGGGGGEGNFSSKVTVDHKGDITVSGVGSKAIMAQSVGGSGGNGGDAYTGAFSAGFYASGAIGVSVGGEGGNGGNGGDVTVIADGNLKSDTTAVGSGGILAQSIGGGGGNGGRAASISGAVSNGASIALGVTVGGWAGDGGKSGTVIVKTGLEEGGSIVTNGDSAVGILAQSVGGSGGNGGSAWSAAGGYGVNVSVNATVTIGGGGGEGNTSGNVQVANAMTITTGGDMSSAIVAQSIGGGGGNGGATDGATADLGGGNGVNVAVNVGVGGGAGNGNTSGTVDVSNSGRLTTTGDYSSGIVAQSIGGGGGMGGSANAKAYHVGGTSQTSVTAQVGISGDGGEGNDAACASDADGNPTCAAGTYGVHVDNTGEISTRGFNSIGIMAMSVGGGGGAGGSASTDEDIVGGGSAGKTSVGIGAAIALAAGGAGNGGTVWVRNTSTITTDGADSYGISASSIGGGGGVGGSASSGTIGEYAIGGALGGKGGGGGDGAAVEVFNTATAYIHTKQERSIGIFAQSIGGGGGAGGAGSSKGKSDKGEVSVHLSLGGAGNVGGDAGTVYVKNEGRIDTDAANSHGILAQSIGGSGGVGGASGTSANDAKVAITLSLGGAGGGGGMGNTVTVKNDTTGVIHTLGDNSHGIFAQSIGGGGGAAGGGSTKTGKAETAVSLAVGGQGGEGSSGGSVYVDNSGYIETEGYLSHGIFAQSVGGGGGASGAAALASEADTTVGGAIAGFDVTDPLNNTPNAGGVGGYVEVRNSGEIVTWKAGSYGILAQSIGGGGGYGGIVSADSGSDDSYAFTLGGSGGTGGAGGNVYVEVSGSIITHGERAYGVFAQSVGGGGGIGGDAKGKTSNQLALGGQGGEGGAGGNVTVKRTGTITTIGKDSIAIFAQSIGGGGGLGGAGFGRFGADADGGGGLDNNTVGFRSNSGGKGSGGIVTIEQTGAVETDGDRSHGVVAQAVGGGGGAGGMASLAMGESGAGSAGGEGDAAAATATVNSQVWVKGRSSYALFGQSATGIGNANEVKLTAGDNLFAQGEDSVAAYGQSTTGQGTRGAILMYLNGHYTIGGGNTGLAIDLVGGTDNVVSNHSLTYAMKSAFGFQMLPEDYAAYLAEVASSTGPVVPEAAILGSVLTEFSPLSIAGGFGNDRIDNERTETTLGRVIGNIDLGLGDNSFHNFVNSSMVNVSILDPVTLAVLTPATIKLNGGTFFNEGLMTNNGIGVLGALSITGGYDQASDGDLVTDIDLDHHKTDFTGLTGAGVFHGDAPLNFLSIDRLFDRDGYVIATGDSIETDMTPTLTHPAVGFDFKTRSQASASGPGEDLVLYSDTPTFKDLVKDPALGVKDPGVAQMAQYLDGLEDVQALYDSPSELARMINMLRFSRTAEELGKALTRLTPHYAVHTFEMLNRSTDIMLDSARECADQPRTYDYDGRCAWLSVSPQAEYRRDAGPHTTDRKDVLKTMSLGGIGEVGDNWSLGATIGRTEFNSKIDNGPDLLSETDGESWQAYALAKYQKDRYFADFALGGGTGHFTGKRDTHVDPVSYIPGEQLGGIYLPEVYFPGIGDSVTYRQDTSQFGVSARFGMTQEMGAFYLKPTLQLDARWFKITGKEKGSVAAFDFGDSTNLYYSATPGLEVGTDIALSETASLRLYAKGGVEFSDKNWKIKGQFAAAEGLGAPPLVLTEEVDSPLYRVGAGVELNGVNGVGLSVRYNGAFGDKVDMNAFSANLKVRF